jgi:hypothetical protein
LISTRSTSSIVFPAFSSARAPAFAGEPAPLGELLARDDQRSGAVVHARRVPGRGRPLRVEDRPERGQLLERGVAPRRLVRLDAVHGDELVRVATLVRGRDGALVRAQRPFVLLLARDAELAGDEGRLLDHVLAVERRHEAVVEHEVDDGAVAEPVAETGLLEDIRRVRHRLHPARHDHVVVAGADHLVGHLDRADAGGADLVDRVRGHLLREPGADGGLTGGRLAGAALQHLAHDHVLDLVADDARPLERRADRDGAEPGRLEVAQAAAELPERRADCRDDDGASHEISVPTGTQRPRRSRQASARATRWAIDGCVSMIT